MSPRLSAAFALVMLGELNTDRYGPLQYLLNSVNQRTWRGVASCVSDRIGARAAHPSEPFTACWAWPLRMRKSS